MIPSDHCPVCGDAGEPLPPLDLWCSNCSAELSVLHAAYRAGMEAAAKIAEIDYRDSGNETIAQYIAAAIRHAAGNET